ncbi:hypothetical protein Salat_1522200 [Sesamum alatum]|uniref:Uncharacterized protein n=1 Tax=Sesamum alatum TaxID=300844 RepID=A0AAE2CMF2_9LAMI|nr:hypothetical protein Salat_1522200 [Sesamum alatum]
MALSYASMGPAAYLPGYTELEKRQVFLRSYQFSRKQSVAERIKKSFFRVKKVMWVRFRSARKLRKLLWLKLKNGLFFTTRRRRFFLRLHNSSSYGFCHGSSKGCSWQSSCLW